MRVDGHPGLGVRVHVADLGHVDRPGDAADLGQAERGQAVDEAGVDGPARAVDHGRARRRRQVRAHGRDLPARDHDRALLDDGAGDGDDRAPVMAMSAGGRGQAGLAREREAPTRRTPAARAHGVLTPRGARSRARSK